MRKKLALLVSLLVLANAIAGTILYWVYFPWAANKSYVEAEEKIYAQIRDLNLHFAENDYKSSPLYIDQASVKFQVNLKALSKEKLMLPVDLRRLLDNQRYILYMDSPQGPEGYIRLSSELFLLAGPYFVDHNSITRTDWVVYFLLLIFFNCICVYLAYTFVIRKLNRANQPLSNYLNKIHRQPLSDPLDNVALNTSNLIEHISLLEKQHQINLNNQRDLMHAVAHEFRGPMARITFALDLLNDKDSSQDPNSLKENIESALTELDSLVTEVLDYSRLKDGHQNLKPEYFDVVASLETILSKTKAVYPEKQFTLNNLSDSETIECFLDQRLTERAIINLVRNAARFSLKQVLISININNDADLEIAIEDDGSGVPPGKRERILEPFTRLDYSRNRDSGGVGLGLAIVNSVIKRHEGVLQVNDSKKLGGAAFVVTLPVSIRGIAE